MNNKFLLLIFFSCSLLAMEDKKVVVEFKERRQSVLELVAQKHKESGSCIFFSGFDYDSKPFTQESSFYYLTGHENPGLTLMLQQNQSTIFGPHYLRNPLIWTDQSLLSKETISDAGFDNFSFLGEPIEPGTTSELCNNPAHFTNLINSLKQSIQEKQKIYTLNSVDEGHCTEHISFLHELMKHVPELANSIDIFNIVARMRRIKSDYEIKKYKIRLIFL